MTRGRKPKPRNLRLLHGQKDRNPEEPELPVVAPDPPDYLDDNEAAIFRDLAGKLARMRVMTTADTDALAMCANRYAQWLEAVEKIKEEGLVNESDRGIRSPNVWFGIAERCQKEALRILSEFGLTPSSRTRIKSL